MIRIRVDDFPNTRDGEKDKHSLAAYREFHRVLSECIGGRRYLLGVIPKRCSVEDVLYIRNETDVDVGMHGVYHDEAKLDLHQNEFAPYLSQYDVASQLISAGLALQTVVEREVLIYMPPRNRIDRRTINVLLDCGFLGYTTGPETEAALRVPSEGLFCIHSEPPHEYGRTDELLQRGSHIELMKRSDAGAHPVLTLHWTWETNVGLDHMRKFFAEIQKSYFEDFNV